MFSVYNEYKHRRQSLNDITFSDYSNFDYRVCNDILHAYADQNRIVLTDDNTESVRSQMFKEFFEREMFFKQ